jgi:hypothetical protein
MNIRLPEGLTVKVIDQKEDTLYFMLPHHPKDVYGFDLTPEQLEKVAGGFGLMAAGAGIQMGGQALGMVAGLGGTIAGIVGAATGDKKAIQAAQIMGGLSQALPQMGQAVGQGVMGFGLT